ncbi:MAG TPA: glycosyltransferase [Pilimelia sp.]|nr:glycosyltransferase [Pilimelia sp.]
MLHTTVVIASHNRRRTLLRYLPEHRAPVILVDNGSEDGTAAAVAARFPDVRIARLPDNIGAAARNIGASMATTPYVAFADDDSYWEGDSLRAAEDLFGAYPRAALLTAQIRVGPEVRLDPVSAYMGTAPLGAPADLPGPAVLGFLACAAVVRREAFLAAGGFAPKLHVYGEEALLALDHAAPGWGLSYVPGLWVRHLPARGGRDPVARARQEVRNRLLTTWLRRPAGLGLRAATRALADPAQRPGLVAALRELPWVVRERHALPPAVEADVAALERASAGYEAELAARAGRADAEAAVGVGS